MSGTIEKRVSSSERAALLRYCAALSVLEETGVDERVRMIKYGARDLGLARTRLSNLWREIVDTIPVDQLAQLQQHIRHAVLRIGITRMSAAEYDRTYGQFLTYDAIAAVVDACKDHCMTCAFDKHAAKRCPLRRALDEMNVTQTEGATICPYMGI